MICPACKSAMNVYRENWWFCIFCGLLRPSDSEPGALPPTSDPEKRKRDLKGEKDG